MSVLLTTSTFKQKKWVNATYTTMKIVYKCNSIKTELTLTFRCAFPSMLLNHRQMPYTYLYNSLRSDYAYTIICTKLYDDCCRNIILWCRLWFNWMTWPILQHEKALSVARICWWFLVWYWFHYRVAIQTDFNHSVLLHTCL